MIHRLTAHLHRLVRLVVLTLAICLTACGTTAPKDVLAYQSEPFRAEIVGELHGVAISATVAHTAAPNALTVTFTSPTALQGLTLHRADGKDTLSLDSMMPNVPQPKGLTDLLSLFSLSGTPQSIAADNGMTVAVFSLSNGGTCTLTLDAETGLPRAMETAGIKLEIASFEQKE